MSSKLQQLINSLPNSASAFASQLQQAENALLDTMSKASAAGLSRQGAELNAQRKLNKEIEKFQKRYFQAMSAGNNTRMAELETQFRERIKHEKKVGEYRKKAYEQTITDMDQGIEDFVSKYQSGLVEGAENAAEALGKGFDDLQNNLKNLDVKGFGEMLKGGGGLLKNAGGGMGGNMGKMVAQLGRVVAGIGAVVGVLGVFAAVMMEADKKAKEMNSSLMDGVSVFDLGVTKTGELTNTLHTMRQTAFEVGSEFRLSGDEVIGLANAFMTAGMTMREFEQFTGAGDSFSGLEDSLRETLSLSRLLGMDAKELAQTYTKMNEDFGMDLDQIGNAFRDIYTAANLSSIGTQKFMSMITSATGSLALFNVDFNEAAALASEFIETLGEEGASELLGNLSGKFGQMGYQERTKTTMLAGGSVRKGIRSGMEASANQLMSGAAGDAIQEILDDMGFGGMGLAEALMDKNMTNKRQRELVDRASMSGMADEFVRKLNQTTLQANALRTDVTKGMGAMDAGSTLATIQAIADNFGAGDIRSAGRTGMMVAEEVTGMSGAELDRYLQVVDKLKGQYEGIQRQFKELEGMSAEEQEKRLKKIEEEYKVRLGAKGEMINMQTGQEITSLNEYLASMSTPTDLEEALTKDQMLAQEAVTETRTLNAIMENTIGAILDNIYQLLTGWMSFSRDQGEAKQLSDFIASMSSKKGNLIEQETELKTRLRTEKDLTEEDKENIRGRLDTIKGQKRLIDTAMRRAPTQGSDFFGDYADTEEEMMAGMNLLTEDVRKKLFPQTGIVGYEKSGSIKDGTRVETPIYGNVGESLDQILEGSETDAKTLADTLTEASTTAKNTGKDGEVVKASDRTTSAVNSLISYQESLDVAQALGISRKDAMLTMERERTGKGKGKTAETYFGKDKFSDTTISDADYNKRRDTLVAAGLISGRDYARRPAVQDFVYTGGANGGVIRPISSSDEFLGMKPNGAVDRALQRNGSGEGNVIVNVHVNATDRSMGQKIASALKSDSFVSSLSAKRKK